MILVDTSAWIRHLRARDSRLVKLLTELRVVTCDVVVGDLALGSGLPPEFRGLLAHLPKVATPSSRDVLDFITRHDKAFRTVGVGWADAQILAAAANAGALLYSHDSPQRTAWRRLGFRLV